MSKEDNVRELLKEAAEEIQELDDNPRTWLSWIVYLLAHLEDRVSTSSTSSRESYTEMLSALQDELRNRTRTGGWN